MNQQIRQLAEQAGMVKILEEHAHEYGNGTFENTPYPELEKFVELIVKECNQAVLEVPLYYKDYRSQIEEAVIRDCARAVLEKFGVEQ
jgi:thymidylate synthase ThyX